MFLHRQVVTAEASRRVTQGKELGIDDVKPVTLDASRLEKVKGEKPTDAGVAPMLKWTQSRAGFRTTRSTRFKEPQRRNGRQ
jgi:hypothetical protein